MHTEPEDISGTWLDAHCAVSFAELVQLSGFAPAELRELVEFGALAPENREEVHETRWIFRGECVVTARAASRLRASFDLDTSALALALAYLERIRVLEADLHALRAQLPHGFSRG